MTPTAEAVGLLPFTREEAVTELQRRYPRAFDGTDPIDRHDGLRVENARDWVLAVVALSAVPDGKGFSALPASPSVPTGDAEGDVVTPEDWWIEWSGGERPVDRYTLVTIRRRDGREVCDKAFKFDWTNEHYVGVQSDIVAYRVEQATPSSDTTAGGA